MVEKLRIFNIKVISIEAPGIEIEEGKQIDNYKIQKEVQVIFSSSFLTISILVIHDNTYSILFIENMT